MIYERDYVGDERVREKFNPIFSILRASAHFSRVVDLGPGGSTEYARFGQPEAYMGIELRDSPLVDPGVERVQADYRAHNLASCIRDRDFKGVISLFSTELYASPQDNAAFYDRIFADSPQVGSIFVTGVHSTKFMDERFVKEGSHEYYQTFTDIRPEETGRNFDELRLTVPNPSRIFGDEEVAVLRVLFRKEAFSEEDAQLCENLAALPFVTAVDTTIPRLAHRIPKLGAPANSA